MACLALRFSDLNTLPGWSKEISAQARVPISKLPRHSCHLAGKPPSSCSGLAPTRGPCPQLCPTPLLLTLTPSHLTGEVGPRPGSREDTMRGAGPAQGAGVGGATVSEARRALGEGQAPACLRSRWSDQSPLSCQLWNVKPGLGDILAAL